MKKTGEIVGLPIVSLVDGGEIGTVRALVIDAKTAAIAAVVVDDGNWYKNAKLVAFNDILGIGESALTIEQKGVIKELAQVGNLEALLAANVNVLNTKVLSKKGQIKGTIVEVYYDDETGKIVECHAKAENGTDFTIPANKLYTLASAITVINDDGETTTTSRPAATEQPVAAPAAAQPAVEQAPAQKAEEKEKAAQTQPDAAPAEEEAADANSAMQKFEDRQKKFLLGKKATRKISADNGTLIIDQGEEVTEEILQKAKLAGKFVELSMSLQ